MTFGLDLELQMGYIGEFSRRMAENLGYLQNLGISFARDDSRSRAPIPM